MNKERATEILRQVALENGVSLTEVRKEIQIAIEAGMSNPDPAVQSEWKAISQDGHPPSPEDLIIYLVKKIKREDTNSGGIIKFPFS